MKYLIFSLILMSTMTNGQCYDPNQYFNVTGDAVVNFEPNRVILTLGVETRGESLLDVKKENYHITSRLIDYLKKQGIKEKHIQTDYVNINPNYDYKKPMKVNFYNVSQTVRVTLEDINKYDKILTDVTEMGINRVNNVQFENTEVNKYKDKARKLAIQAAKEKAKMLSKEAGFEMGKLIKVIENNPNPVAYKTMSRGNAMAMDMSESAGPSISPGSLSINARIELVYALK